MRLSQFILENLEPILQEWEDFARSLETGHAMSIEALRNDAERMLRCVAADVEKEQTRREEIAKSQGHGASLPAGQSSAAHEHGVTRAVERFSLVEVVSEYRALRASVMRLWTDAVPITRDSVAQLIRFNEAIDQILAEGVLRFTEHIDREADLFTASVGHDLSNPVNTIVISAPVLAASDSLSATERLAAERIGRAAERLSGMLVDLRDFTRARLGGLVRIDRESCDVGKIVRAIVDEMAAVHRDRPIVVECADDLQAFVDRKRIGQLVSNLVANALQHATEPTLVGVRAWGDAHKVTVEVHNGGPAIPADRLKTMFDPLVRAAGDRDDRRLGLGLYIVRQIAPTVGRSRCRLRRLQGHALRRLCRAPTHATRRTLPIRTRQCALGVASVVMAERRGLRHRVPDRAAVPLSLLQRIHKTRTFEARPPRRAIPASLINPARSSGD